MLDKLSQFGRRLGNQMLSAVQELIVNEESGETSLMVAAAQNRTDFMRQALKAGEIGGIVHCYAYSKEIAKIYLDMGLSFGIGGVLTFNNAKKLKEVVDYLPMEAIVLETDCPYLAPVPFRGKRNDSRNLLYVAREIAAIKGLEPKQVIEITARNARKVYRMD